MTLHFSTSVALLRYASEEQLYDKLVAQLVKDFGLANSYIDIPIDSLPEEVHKALHERVYVLLMEKFTEYLNLLYVIDVPEKAFREIRSTDTVEIALQVALLILKRELQKVLLKQQYSS